MTLENVNGVARDAVKLTQVVNNSYHNGYKTSTCNGSSYGMALLR